MALKQPVPRYTVVPTKNTPYTIEESIQDAVPFPLDSPLIVSSLVLKWLLWGLYTSYRLRSLSDFGRFTSATSWATWLLFLAEVCALLPPALFQLDLCLYLPYGRRGWRRNAARLLGDVAPTIDIFITCCGEDVDLIMDTVVAAASQDYPRHRYRVFVLDDAKSPALERAVTSYNDHRSSDSSTFDVTYLSRTKIPGKPHYFKAGNLRFGILESTKIGFASEFIAALDVDAIAEPGWLRRTVPHLILDGKLALVNSAQVPYNLPESDILQQGSASSNSWLDALRDNVNALTCYGSGYVLRRSALDDIGGWPQVAVGEDIFCGFLLAGHGWDIAFCGEVLQRDLMPGSLDALVMQRMRWMDGDLNLAKGFKLFLPGLDPCSRRTTVQRITAIINSLRLFRAVTDTIFPLIMASLLCTLTKPSHVAGSEVGNGNSALKYIYLTSILMDKLSSIFLFGGLSGLTNSELWLSPYKALSVARFCLSGRILSFQPTCTVVSTVNERSDRLRRPLRNRLLTPEALISFLYTSCATFSVALYLRNSHARTACPPPGSCFMTGVLVWLLECIFKMSIPLRYMIWPPSIPDRKELLEKDEFGISRPKNLRRQAGGNVEISWLDILQVALVLYVDWNVL